MVRVLLVEQLYRAWSINAEDHPVLTASDLPPDPSRRMSFIYLASQSPRRRQLLEQLGVRHELLLPDAGEDTEAHRGRAAGRGAGALRASASPALKLDAALARLKRRGLPPAPVLCSDTTVALGRASTASRRTRRCGAHAARAVGRHAPRADGRGRAARHASGCEP